MASRKAERSFTIPSIPSRNRTAARRVLPRASRRCDDPTPLVVLRGRHRARRCADRARWLRRGAAVPRRAGSPGRRPVLRRVRCQPRFGRAGALLAAGTDGVPSRDEAWQRYMRWPAYGTQAWLGNVNQWGQHSGAEMVERQFAALADYDTIALLTAGRSPRRRFVPGDGAYPLAPALRDEMARRTAS